ncbi:MAG TPA: WXG100 family type VII secretion target [Aggregatilineales bacterium]|nr:WXG100 family type VII secretion target [Anaerolineales bacterium]HRE46783.1 WXG100 family type VII secretion target [Aggregatilineales bacterium]
MAGKIQCDYDQMGKVADTFSKESGQTQQLFQQLSKIAGDLAGGGWVGEGNDKFQTEFNDIVKKAMDKLVRVLEDAASASKRISDALKQAEDESGGLFA